MSDPPSLEELRSRLREAKPGLAETYGVSEIGIFGSYARGDQEPASDVDILVSFEEPIGLIRFVGLQEELGDLLGVEVDLTTRNALKPWMRDRVENEVVTA